MHLDEERIARLIDGELSREEERDVREHLAACAACRAHVEGAEVEAAEVRALLGRLDPPARVAAPVTPIAPRPAPIVLRPSSPGTRAWLLRAAGLLLLLGLAGAASALPGSPFHGWIDALLTRRPGGAGPARPDSAVTPPVHAPESVGIALAPGDSMLIVFRRAPVEGHLRITLADRERLVIRGPQGAATYASETGRVTVDAGASGASFELEIPVTAPRVEVRVGTRRVFLKRAGDRPLSDTPPVDGVYLIALGIH